MRYTIKDLPDDLRPRERLLKYGGEALSTSELLAIILRTGTKRHNVIDLSNFLLCRYKGNLRSLFSASAAELSKIDGIKMAKATQIKACFELSKRLATLRGEDRPIIGKPEDAIDLLMDMRYFEREEMRCLFLNTKNEVLEKKTLSIGGLDVNLSRPREVFRLALSFNSASFILAHNHPSGDPKPSAADIEYTERMIEAGDIIGIPLLDHLVIGDGYFSMKKEGLI